MFALITPEIARHNGDVNAGIPAALTWIADNLPVYCVNFILITATELWALRYPDTNELWVLERSAGGASGDFDAKTDRIHARSDDLPQRPSVTLASEPMDDDDWRLLHPGELLHVDLTVDTTMPFPEPPRHPLAPDDLAVDVVVSQQAPRSGWLVP